MVGLDLFCSGHLLAGEDAVIIALDVDGPLADSLGAVLRRYNADWDDALTLEHITTWAIHPHVKPECGKAIYDYFRLPNLYDEVAVVEDAIWGVGQLRELGHTVRFVTANMFDMTDPKARWLLRHGFTTDEQPHFLPRDLYVAQDKTAIDADLLIDDRAETVRKWVDNKRRKAILFEYPWNRSLVDEVPSTFWSWAHRARTWKQIIKIVEGLWRPG